MAPLHRPLVSIVDDDVAVRDSLALLLGLHGFDVQAFASGEQFLQWAGTKSVDCVLLDLRMAGMSGLDVQAALTARGLRYPVVLLTAHGDVATTRTALKSGAFDFVEKPFDGDVLLRVIRAAVEVSEVSRAQTEREARFAHALSRLTPREREVLDHVLDGRHNREIAALLHISPRTVEVYKARIMDKLDVDRLPDLIRLALEMGLGR
ncbi:MAG TPA: response regulator [Casimicrobiaceae bacterium]|jgi:RNA polymerase sigma factor (sigma-70 family)|nr:response regulator [Casimicrobiaceae bacterium]